MSIVTSSNMHMVSILLGVLICVLKAAGVKRHKDDTVGSMLSCTASRREGCGLVKLVICREIWSYECKESILRASLVQSKSEVPGTLIFDCALQDHSSSLAILNCIFALHEPFSVVIAGSLLFLHFLGKPVEKAYLCSIQEDGHLSHFEEK